MALASTADEYYVTVSSATQSDHLSLPSRPNGAYILGFTSSGAFALDVQVSNDGGSNFVDLYDVNGKVTINTATPTKQHIVVRGGAVYRMDVDTYNNPITMRATAT